MELQARILPLLRTAVLCLGLYTRPEYKISFEKKDFAVLESFKTTGLLGIDVTFSGKHFLRIKVIITVKQSIRYLVSFSLPRDRY